MDYASKIKELEYQHHKLEQEIGKMQKHPHVEEFRLQELKKEKLTIKDRIRDLYRLQYEDAQRVDLDDDR
jgi:hypothetical protein